ncbi:HNH endonuclease, partial [bacterium]|nr:HNH endonuclease [bacterium]
MKKIRLSQNKVALIDNEDYKLVSKYHWVTLHARDNLYYAYALIKRNGNYTTLRMHRLIMDAPRDLHIDHRNGNGLDNRKRNLRFATQSQNMQNAKPYKNGTSKFKGVSWT